MHYQRIDKFLLAHTNKQNVFRCIMNEGPINKAAIAQRIGLTIPSVMKIVDSNIRIIDKMIINRKQY